MSTTKLNSRMTGAVCSLALFVCVLFVPTSASAGADNGERMRPYRNGVLVRVKKDAIVGFAESIDNRGLVLEKTLSVSEDEVLTQVVAPDGIDNHRLASELAAESGVTSARPRVLTVLPEHFDDIFLDQSTLAILDALKNKKTVNFGRRKGENRKIWVGYVNQPATEIIELFGVPRKYRGRGAVVAIIDTGVDRKHLLLKGRLVKGYDFLRDKRGVASDRSLLKKSTRALLDQSTLAILDQSTIALLDQSTLAILDQSTIALLDSQDIVLPPALGHGTLVAGIVHLVAPKAKIMPLRVFDGYGVANLFDIVQAIYYAIEQEVTVINMSFHLEDLPEELWIAIDAAENAGIVVVGAAGNHGEAAIIYPAAMANVIGVGATDNADFLASFSNYGNSLVTLAAPGVSIITSWFGGGWAAASGTSFAAPFVSGAVALIADKLGDGGPSEKTFDAVLQAFESSEDVLGLHGDEVGFGRLNARRAIEQAEAP